MQEFGESFVPSEDGNAQGGVSESAAEATERAKQQFAGTKKALQQLAKEEKKAKKGDRSVADTIVQFLTDAQRTHLAVLIARLIARDCPPLFVLAILSLINEQCRLQVEESLAGEEIDADALSTLAIVGQNAELSEKANVDIGNWITRMQAALHLHTEGIMQALLIDQGNLDGTVLQLTTFVLEEFLEAQGKKAPFEHLQNLSMKILQTLFEPHMHLVQQTLEGPQSEED